MYSLSLEILRTCNILTRNIDNLITITRYSAKKSNHGGIWRCSKRPPCPAKCLARGNRDQASKTLWGVLLSKEIEKLGNWNPGLSYQNLDRAPAWTEPLLGRAEPIFTVSVSYLHYLKLQVEEIEKVKCICKCFSIRKITSGTLFSQL